MCDVLRDRAKRDTIRRIHLRHEDSGLLSSIISQSTVTCDGIRSNSVASFILCSWDNAPVDVSSFFALCSFPKLQQLNLKNCTISSRDLTTSRTTVLTTISLDFTNTLPALPTSQLLSIFASSPALRKVKFSGCVGPSDGDGRSSPVQLRHLKKLQSDGDLQHVFGLLDRLDNPRNMDLLSLTLGNYGVADVSRIIGPYLRDHIQRREKSPGGLFLFLSPFGYLALRVGDADRTNPSTQAGLYTHSLVYIGMVPNPQYHEDREKAALDPITHTTQLRRRIHRTQRRRRIHTSLIPEDTILLRYTSTQGVSKFRPGSGREDLPSSGAPPSGVYLFGRRGLESTHGLLGLSRLLWKPIGYAHDR